MDKKDLKPASVFHYFEEICQVPRPSKREEKIIAYLKAFGEKHGLETKTDEAGNVLIKKPATPGRENLKTVILQSHIDMVCEKNSDVEHDFLTDPIETVIDGEWLKAKGTTLGADNGIGVATELAILASDDIEHGPLECLFTVDEETGLTGAFALKEGFMSGDILINLDSEDEGELFIGCAGGANTTAEFAYQPVPAPQDYFYFSVAVKGLTGGHSGDDINKGRANANKLLVRFLTQLAAKYPMYLCEIDGGNLHNAIPREARALCAVPMKDKESVRVDLNIYTAEIEKEFAVTEPNLKTELSSEAPCKEAIDMVTAGRLLKAVYAVHNGVYAMSQDIPGLVETSSNLASVKQADRKSVVMEGMYRGVTGKLDEVRQSFSKELQFTSAQQVSAYEALAGSLKDGLETLLAEFRYLSQQNSAIYDYHCKEREAARDALRNDTFFEDNLSNYYYYLLYDEFGR